MVANLCLTDETLIVRPEDQRGEGGSHTIEGLSLGAPCHILENSLDLLMVTFSFLNQTIPVLIFAAFIAAHLFSL